MASPPPPPPPPQHSLPATITVEETQQPFPSASSTDAVVVKMDDCELGLGRGEDVSTPNVAEGRQEDEFHTPLASSGDKMEACCALGPTPERRVLGGIPTLKEGSGNNGALEVKKKVLLGELEAVQMKGVQDDFTIPRSLGMGMGMGIEVIDDTALIQTIPIPPSANRRRRSTCERDAADPSKNGNGARRGGRKAKAGKNSAVAAKGRLLQESEKEGGKRGYTRVEMEGLRFVNKAAQRRLWKAIYSAFDAAVANEYDSLVSNPHHNTMPSNLHPPPPPPPPLCLTNNQHALPILSVGAANGRWRYMNVYVH